MRNGQHYSADGTRIELTGFDNRAYDRGSSTLDSPSKQRPISTLSESVGPPAYTSSSRGPPSSYNTTVPRPPPSEKPDDRARCTKCQAIVGLLIFLVLAVAVIIVVVVVFAKSEWLLF